MQPVHAKMKGLETTYGRLDPPPPPHPPSAPDTCNVTAAATAVLITASTSVMISTGRQEQPCASALSVLQLSVVRSSSSAACPACIRAGV
jgi:hypothetical protein